MAADTKLCSLVEEGTLRICDTLQNILYHKSLNVLLIFTQDKSVSVLDVTSGTVLHSTTLEPCGAAGKWDVRCLSVPKKGSVLFCHEDLLSVRKDYGRILLLDSAFQKPVGQPDEVVLMEMPHSEAMLLKDYLQSMDLSNVDPDLSSQHASLVNLLSQHVKCHTSNLGKGQRPWSIARIELPLKAMKAVCSHALAEMKNRSCPALSVAASVVVRLMALARKTDFVVSKEDSGTSVNNNNAPQNPWDPPSNFLNPLMSEAARRETFGAWPHMNYKWALPHQMAEAGFYHQPNTPQSDRAVCFLCNLCLICWEPSDEPWSEHERHAPNCPLVKGDYTVNVPVGITMATQPPASHSERGERIACISTTIAPDFVATGTESGSIVLWNIGGPLKREASFDICDAAGCCPSVCSLFVADNSKFRESGPNPYACDCSLFAGGSVGDKPCILVLGIQRKPAIDVAEKTLTTEDFVAGKGGATKKVVNPTPAPPQMGTSDKELFFSFCDDPLVEEIYISGHAVDSGTKLGKYEQLPPGLFTNPVLMPPSQFDKNSSSVSAASTSDAGSKIIKPLPAPVAAEPKIWKISLLDLTSFGLPKGLTVVSMTPVDDDHVLVVVAAPTVTLNPAKQEFVLSPILGSSEDGSPGHLTNDEEKEAALRSIWMDHSSANVEDESKSYLLLFKLTAGEERGLTLSDPIHITEVPAKETPVSISIIPASEPVDPECSYIRPSNRRLAAVVSRDGILRLLGIDASLTWIQTYSRAKRFSCVDYCSGVERLAAGTSTGELIFFRVNRPSSEGEKPKMSKGKAPLKLVVQQPLEREVVLHALHELIQTENLPPNCAPQISASACWTELLPSQRQRRQPQSWLLQQGAAAVDEANQLNKVFRLQQDRFSWDEHLFEITLPQYMTVAHVNLRFTLTSGCTSPPHIQVSLLQQNSRSLQWDKEKEHEEVDMGVNFSLNGPAQDATCTVNPVLTEAFLEAHDATLLCGPVSLCSFIDSSCQSGVLNLSSMQLLSSHGKTLLLHLKYMPAPDNNLTNLLDARKTKGESASRKTSQTLRGCDFIQEVAITVRRHQTTLLSQERLQRTAMLSSADFSAKLVQYICQCKVRHKIIRALEILNWKNAVLCGSSRVEAVSDIEKHVDHMKQHLKDLLENCFMRGCRDVAQQVAQALISTYEVALQCLSEQTVNSFTSELLSCSIKSLSSLTNCSNPTSVHWYLVLLSRVSSLGAAAVASAAQALLNRIVSELAKRENPLNQLMRTRFGLYGKPFDEELFNVESFPASRAAKPELSAYSMLLGNSDASNFEALLLKRPSDLKRVEPLAFTVHSASDGVRLERSDAGNSQFTLVSLSGLLEASRNGQKLENSDDVYQKWQHLFVCPQMSPTLVMERLHGGTRKYVTLDFGTSVLLTDLVIPACADWAGLVVDTWAGDRGKTDVDATRLATSTNISRAPLVLRMMQPPLMCRFLRITVVGRQGSNSTSSRTPAGYFYGHTMALSTDLAKPDSCSEASQEEIKEHVATLDLVADHIRCHYSLACDQLRGQLAPLLTRGDLLEAASLTQNVDHFLRNQLASHSPDSASEEDKKVHVAYEECLKLQHQLNILRGTRERLNRSLQESSQADNLPSPVDQNSSSAIADCSTDKLEHVACGLTHLLLTLVTEEKHAIERDDAIRLFKHLVVSSPPSAQLACAALLVQTCSYQVWWPAFLAQMLLETMASTVEASRYPKDRIFLTILYMANKSLGCSLDSGLLDPTIQAIASLLDPVVISQTRFTLCDFPLVNWLLLFCSHCLDKTTNYSGRLSSRKLADQRWDFLQGEASLRKDENVAAVSAKNSFAASHRCMRRKIQKKLMNQQEYTLTSFPGSVGLAPAAKTKFAQMYAKHLKGAVSSAGAELRASRRPAVEVVDEEDTEVAKEEGPYFSLPNLVTRDVAIEASKKLVALLVSLGRCTSQVETFALTCKVLARLSSAVEPSIGLVDVMTQEQLTGLLRIAAADQKTPLQLWLNHAVSSLLCDYVKTSIPETEVKTVDIQMAGPSKSETATVVDSAMDWWPSQTAKNAASPMPAQAASSQMKQPLFKMVMSSNSSSKLYDIDDFMDIFGSTSSSSVENMPPGLKKAWPSISSVMKNMLDSKRSVPTTVAGSVSDDRYATGWDQRDEQRVDGPWKHKLEALSTGYWTSVAHGLSSTVQGSEQQASARTTKAEKEQIPQQTFLASAFTELFSSSTRLWNSLDVIAVLKLWLQLLTSTGENYDYQKGPCGETKDTEEAPFLVLNEENVRNILSALTRINAMDVGDWCIVLESLTWLCGLRCIRERRGSSQPADDIADQTCAGLVLRDPKLVKILYHLLSGKGLVSSTAGDRRQAGPRLVGALRNLMSRIRIWCTGGSLAPSLQSSLFSLLLDLCSVPSGSVAQEEGPADALHCFIEALTKIDCRTLKQDLGLSFISSIVTIASSKVRQRGTVVCVDDLLRSTVDAGVCTGFLGIGYSQNRPQSPSSQEVLGRNAVLNTCLSLAVDLLRQNPKLACSVLSNGETMTELLDAVNSCASTPLASTLGTAMFREECSPLSVTTTADHVIYFLLQLLRDPTGLQLFFQQFADYAVAMTGYETASSLSEPFVVLMLHVLGSEKNIELFLQHGGFNAVCRALASGAPLPPNPSSHMVNQVLRYLSQVYSSTASSSRIPRSNSSRTAGLPQPPALISSAAGAGILRKNNLRLEEEEENGLINFAPLSTVTSNQSSAQSADVLLQPSPPHRRARSPAWSHHFYPGDQFIELVISLPCAVLLKEIHLHPHLASLSTCPSSVGVEISSEVPVTFSPVGTAVSVTGLTTIVLRLEMHRVASSVLLRLYKPRDSSNIGLAQIRILGTLALPSLSSESLQADNSIDSMWWLGFLHHCLLVASKNNKQLTLSLCNAASSISGLVENCCSLLLGCPQSAGKLTCLPDASQMAYEVLVYLCRYSPDVAKRTVDLLLELSASPSGFIPIVGSLLYTVCACPGSEVSVQTLLRWIHSVAQSSLQGSKISVPALLVHSAASVIWNVPCAAGFIDPSFISAVYQWHRAAGESQLKEVLDFTLCAAVHRIPALFQELFTWLNSTEFSQASPLTYPVLGEKRAMLTLARVSQSAGALRKLAEVGLIQYLTHIVMDFCRGQLGSYKSGTTTSVATDALEFLTVIHKSPDARIISLLSTAPSLLNQLVAASCALPVEEKTFGFQDAVIYFLRQLCWVNQENSKQLALAVLHLLQSRDNSSALNGFIRRLLLQLFLEPEKIKVYITCSSGTLGTSSALLTYLAEEPRHPSYPPGSQRVLLHISSETSCAELLGLFTDAPSDLTYSGKPASRLAAGPRRGILAQERKNKSETLKDPLQRLSDLRNVVMPYFLSSPVCAQLPATATLSQVFNRQRTLEPDKWDALELHLNLEQHAASEVNFPTDCSGLATLLDEFAAMGGLAILAQHLPLLSTSSASLTIVQENPTSQRVFSANNFAAMPMPATPGTSNGAVGMSDTVVDSWVKLDGASDDLDEEMEDILGPPNYMTSNIQTNLPKLKQGSSSHISLLPLHSLTAFNLFLSMPLYAEILLQDRRKARILLRLALGVVDDGCGANILQSSEATQLSTLPFKLLQQLLCRYPPQTERGTLLRQEAVDRGVVELLLACLAVLSQQKTSVTVSVPVLQRTFVITTPGTNGTSAGKDSHNQKGKSTTVESDAAPQVPTSAPGGSQQQHYWAKGTGFGTGSTAQSWDVEEALQRQKQQEEQAACVFVTLANYVNPMVDEPEGQTNVQLPSRLLDLLKGSHIVSAMCSYLRNDSVMDMSRHVPLYKALLLLLRALVSSKALVPLLLYNASGSQIYSLLSAMKNCVSTYTARLSAVRGKVANSDDADPEEGIADLSKDICNTWAIVKNAVDSCLGRSDNLVNENCDGNFANSASVFCLKGDVASNPDQSYCEIMKTLQFDSFEMLTVGDSGASEPRFTVSYHFENAVKAAGERSYPSRMKRLAQETATMMTSLPLSSSSSVFVRCDTDRLDIMKVLITGPNETPYSNGCFEFDVYFPPDYPQSPMQVHLATTGRHTVRFNPNLYNDGKVCLSILNTWHGRPEEKWNSHTSSLLQVLVSIQSLILVSEPYFNEPGYERSRGTPSGNQNSRDYDANIRQATVKWAMLEQVKNPSPCFKEAVHAHFWLKRAEVEKQIEEWISEMEGQVASDPGTTRAVAASLVALKRNYGLLKEELARLSPPKLCAAKVEEKPVSQDIKQPPEAASTSSCESMEVDTATKDSTFEEAEFESLKDIFANLDSGSTPPWPEYLDDSEADMDTFVSQFTF